MLEYQRYIRNAQIARAQKLLETKDPEMIKKGPNDVTRFIKRTSVGENGEKAQDSYVVDTSIIEEEENTMDIMPLPLILIRESTMMLPGSWILVPTVTKLRTVSAC